MPPVDRPLRLGELLAETVRLYGERVWAALGLGALVAAGLVLVVAVPHDAGRIPIVALVFTAAYAAAVRLTSGDRFREAWAQVGLRLPVLLVLTLVVSVPFAIGRYDPVLLFVAVFWLGLTGFSIPVAMLERDPAAESWFGRLGYALSRSVVLARTEYLHAVGVSAALVLVYVVLGNYLALALVGIADNGAVAAFLLVQVVLAPFFFIGLAVLYFEQRARALSSRGRP